MDTSAPRTDVVRPDDRATEPVTLPAALYVFRLDANGVASFPFVSQACADLYGCTPEAAMSDAELMHDAIHHDDRRRFDEAGQHSLHTLQPVQWEGRIVRHDRVETRVQVISRPFPQPDGSTVWHGAVVRPEQATSPGGRPPGITHRQVDVLAMLGHDLATPLTAIMLRAELALEKIDEDSSVAGTDVNRLVRRSLEVILRQARRLEGLREDLLALAAADADAIRPRASQVEVLPHLEAAAELAPPDVAITLDCEPGLCCDVQPTHLVQMVSNLVSNAVRHANGRVAVAGRSAGERVLISVWDDGPGVPAAVAARLFTRFVHAELDVPPDGAGSGLGLYIVHTLALANGGTVVHSPGAQGTRFTVALPRAAVDRAP